MSTAEKFDLVIKNGHVITFDPPKILKKYNIGIKSGKNEKITKSALEGEKEIDAKGRYVSPGFIDFHSHVAGQLFSAECVVRQGVTTTIGGERNFNGKLIKDVVENGFLLNQGFYVSHSFTLRRAAGCTNVYYPASHSEIMDMKELAGKFLESGAFGIHFGLEYVPGTSREELIQLCQVAKEYDRPVLIHTRGDASIALEQFDEIEELALGVGAAIHLLHITYQIGYTGVMDEGLKRIEKIIKDGGNITADAGLYAAFPNCIGSSILDRDWIQRYKEVDPAFSEERVLLSSGIYAGERCTPEKFKFIRDNYPATLVAIFACDEREIEKAIVKPYVFISSNAADGPHYEDVGHPETAGTFPKLIRKYVREKNTLTLLDAIYKITAGPAKRFGLAGKGNIRKGYDADIVIFSYDDIKDRADYPGNGDPNATPEGIDFVIVKGDVVCENNIFTGKYNSGTFLKHE